MKQLIPQSRIDEAASEYLYQEAGKTRYSGPTITKRIFNDAVQFTLNEIQPLIVEFAEFAYKNYDYIERISNKREWMWKKNNDCFTTQQLLEEFINYRTMKELEKLLEFESEEERQEFTNDKTQEYER